jgi:hypothetical protein
LKLLLDKCDDNTLLLQSVYNKKVKLSPCFNWALQHDGVLGQWRYSSTHLDLGTTWTWVVSFTPRPLYHQGKSPCYPLDRRLDRPQSRSGHSGEEKNSQPLPGSGPPIIQPVAQRYTNWAIPAPVSIVWGIFNTHEVSGAVHPFVFRRLVIFYTDRCTLHWTPWQSSD